MGCEVAGRGQVYVQCYIRVVEENVEKIVLTFLKRDREKIITREPRGRVRTLQPTCPSWYPVRLPTCNTPTTNVSEFVPREFTNLEYHDQRVRVGTP